MRVLTPAASVAIVVTQRPQEMAANIQTEIATYGRLIRQVGMPLQ